MTPNDPPARRRRRRWPVVLLVVVLLLAGLVVAADRLGHSYAEDRLRAQVADRVDGRGVDVDIEGGTFLDQVVRGRYERIEVGLDSAAANGLTARDVELTLRDVRLPLSDLRSGDYSRAVATSVDGTAEIALAEIAAAVAPRGIRLTPDGSRVRITAPVQVAGVSTSVTGLAVVTVVDGRLRVRLSSLRAAGFDLPDAVARTLGGQLDRLVTTPRLPYGLTLTGVRLDGDELHVTARGSQVRLAA